MGGRHERQNPKTHGKGDPQRGDKQRKKMRGRSQMYTEDRRKNPTSVTHKIESGKKKDEEITRLDLTVIDLLHKRGAYKTKDPLPVSEIFLGLPIPPNQREKKIIALKNKNGPNIWFHYGEKYFQGETKLVCWLDEDYFREIVDFIEMYHSIFR